jgi:hypothetical protein
MINIKLSLNKALEKFTLLNSVGVFITPIVLATVKYIITGDLYKVLLLLKQRMIRVIRLNH